MREHLSTSSFAMEYCVKNGGKCVNKKAVARFDCATAVLSVISGNFCCLDHLEYICMGDALAVVGILVVLGHEAGAEDADAEVVGDAKLAQALAYSFPQQDVDGAGHASLVVQSAVDLGDHFAEDAALLGEGICQLIDFCKSPTSYEIQFEIIQLLVGHCVLHFHLLPSVVVFVFVFCLYIRTGEGSITD